DLYEKSGGKVLDEESFDPNSTDFRTQISKIKTVSPSWIYVATYPNEGALLLKQSRELGLQAQFIGAVAILGGQNFFKIVGDSAEGLIVVNSVPPIDDSSSPETKKF